MGLCIPKLDKDPTTRHHICPESRGGLTVSDNIILLNDKVHSALHTLFGNMILPEMLKQLEKIHHTSLREEYRKQLLELAQEDQYCYKDGIRRKRK